MHYYPPWVFASDCFFEKLLPILALQIGIAASTMPLSTTLRAFHTMQMRHNWGMNMKLCSQLRHQPTKHPFKFKGTFRIASRAVYTRHLSTLSSSSFKPWQMEVVESNGDYRKESFLEDYIGGPLYENQKDLPRLPIPSIEDTMKRFLPTALPLVKSDQEKIALLSACEAFPEQAKVLQERLIDRRENEMKDSSWLQLWWNQVSAQDDIYMVSIFSCPITFIFGFDVSWDICSIEDRS